MSNRLLIVAAAILFSVSPALATGIHTDKGASGQGLAADAFFDPTTTINGISVTPFVNNNAGETLEVFQIPADFTSGTDYLLTFSDITLGYGIFDCANGSNDFAQSEDSTPVDLGSTCTVGPLDSLTTNDGFVDFTEVGNTAKIQFVGGTDSPTTFYFWTPAFTDANGNIIGGNLLSIQAVSATAPEPASLALLACGLIGLMMFRRRIALS